MPYCSNCGNHLNDGDQFCSKCGMPIHGNKNTTFQINVFRMKSFVASLNKYMVSCNGVDVGSVNNGNMLSFTSASAQRFMLKVYPWGDSLAIHRMAREVEIDPSKCKTNVVNVTVKTETKALGIIAPLFSAPAEISIYVDYQ